MCFVFRKVIQYQTLLRYVQQSFLAALETLISSSSFTDIVTAKNENKEHKSKIHVVLRLKKIWR